MLDLTRMTIDTKEYGQIVPESLNFGKDKIILNKCRHAPNFLTITFNPTKIVNGHNLYLLKPSENTAIISSITGFLADSFGSTRYSTFENWNLIHIELSQNRKISDPLAFVNGFAKIAHLQKCSRVHTKNGIHTVVFGPKTRELKLYPKGPQFKKEYGKAFPELIEEANQIVRFERVSNKDGIKKLLGDRSLPTLFDFMSSQRPTEILESAWNQLPPTETTDSAILADNLLKSRSPSQARSILGFHLLSQEIGETAAIQKLGLSRNTTYNFRKALNECTLLAFDSIQEPHQQDYS